MKDFRILSDIENLDYDNASEIAKSLGISQKDAEEILKDLEKKGLIEIEYSDEDIAPGEVLTVLYRCTLTNQGRKVLKNNKEVNI